MLANPYPPATRGKVVVWSLLATFPFGGMTWQPLHYLAGLRRLGFDVWYVEDSDRDIYSPTTFCPTSDYADNVSYLADHMDRIGLGDRWIFRPPGQDFCLGATDLNGLYKLYEEADAVLNICGAQEPRPAHDVIRCLVYVETDPVAMQVAVANGEQWAIQRLDTYDHLFTYGENLGLPDCPVPIERYCWQPTRPPVCIDWWESDDAPAPDAALTSVANWKHTGNDVVWQGETYYWSKHREFQRFIDVASHAVLPLELSVGAIPAAELDDLRQHGWRVARTERLSEPLAYRDYIRTSRGEFTVAKDQYSRLRSGWFSDRSVCYLAAGRPVITQYTGCDRFLPMNEGLFAYATRDEAVAAIEAVAQDYDRHAAAASEIAHEYFAAERVLGDMCRRIGLL